MLPLVLGMPDWIPAVSSGVRTAPLRLAVHHYVGPPCFLSYKLFNVHIVLFIVEIRRVTDDVAILKWRAEWNGAPHPVRRISPQNRPVLHSLGEIIQIPMQREAGDHGIK